MLLEEKNSKMLRHTTKAAWCIGSQACIAGDKKQLSAGLSPVALSLHEVRAVVPHKFFSLCSGRMNPRAECTNCNRIPVKFRPREEPAEPGFTHAPGTPWAWVCYALGTGSREPGFEPKP